MCVATCRRELLPRVFTLASCDAVVFCYGIQKIAPFCDFHSEAPFPVRTFLTVSCQACRGAADRPSFIFSMSIFVAIEEARPIYSPVFFPSGHSAG